MSANDMYTTWGPYSTPAAIKAAPTYDSITLYENGRHIYAVHPIPEIYLLRLDVHERRDLRKYLDHVLRDARNETYIIAANQTLEILTEVQKPCWPARHDPDSPFGPYEKEWIIDILLQGDRKDLTEAVDSFMDTEAKVAGCRFDTDEEYSFTVMLVLAHGPVAQFKAVFDLKNMEALFSRLPARVQHRREVWERT